MRRCLFFFMSGAILLASAGCKSYWVDATIDNQTGKPVRELEVDYPTASFGNNSLAPGASMHYRFQIRGSGPVKVEYSFSDGQVIHAQGPSLAERQQGQLTIHLLPENKVEFLPNLNPAS
jgi:hypothetical protein